MSYNDAPSAHPAPLIECRMKYAEELESLLECPVCFDRPKAAILLCTQGHHVCAKCQSKLRECPMCRSEFVGTRSFMAEDLARKLDEIKISLLDPKHTINKKVLKDKVCVSTQTDKELFLPMTGEIKEESNKNSENILPLPAVPKGKFPCRMNNCNDEQVHGRMIPHLRYYHAQRLYEIQFMKNTYTNSWELHYGINEIYDIALRVNNMGIFFMIIRIDGNGDFYGILQIVNSGTVGQNFHYKLEVTNRQQSIAINDKVSSCKLHREKLAKRHLVVKKSYMETIIDKKGIFDCALTLTYSPKYKSL